jgi:hypothetical protein
MLLESAELEFRIRENMPWATSVDGDLCFVTAFATIRKNRWENSEGMKRTYEIGNEKAKLK